MQQSLLLKSRVISFSFDSRVKKIGIERERVYAEEKNKGMLDPFLPERKEDD